MNAQEKRKSLTGDSLHVDSVGKVFAGQLLGQPEEIPCFRYPDCLSQLQVGRSAYYDEATPIFP